MLFGMDIEGDDLGVATFLSSSFFFLAFFIVIVVFTFFPFTLFSFFPFILPIFFVLTLFIKVILFFFDVFLFVFSGFGLLDSLGSLLGRSLFGSTHDVDLWNKLFSLKKCCQAV